MSDDTHPSSSEPCGKRRTHWFRRILLGLLGLYAALWIAGALIATARAPMEGRNIYTPAIPLNPGDVDLLFDRTGWTEEGKPVSQQQIFPAMLAMIEKAQGAIILDMFLVNQMGAAGGGGNLTYRDTTAQLVEALVAKRRADPDTWILFVTDPINSVYGKDCPASLQPLVDAGGHVVLSNLRALPDSNPLYSLPYRALRPLLQLLPGLEKPAFKHPFDARRERVSPLQLLELLNFKANHRKVLTTRNGSGQWQALVTSSNPHTASSRHDNVAALLRAGPVGAIRNSELRIARDSIRARPELLFSQSTASQIFAAIDRWLNEALQPGAAPPPAAPGAMTVRYCSEKAVGETVDEMLRQASQGDSVEMLMFYLADPRVLRSLRKAAERGASLRLLLDPNKDAFGREKRGIPNRVIATRLHDWAASRGADLTIRWANTQGEQMHSKALRVRLTASGAEHYLLGSANFTTRNLRGSNLESALYLENAGALAETWSESFDVMWTNPDDLTYSLPFDRYASRGFKGGVDRVLTILTNSTGFSSY